jgi:hypothetical protein
VKADTSCSTSGPSGLEILGINRDESPEKPQTVIQQKSITWPQARYDADLIEDRFQISQWPTLVLIDLSGGQRTIVSIGERDHLPLDGDHLAATLTTLLATIQRQQSRPHASGSGQGTEPRLTSDEGRHPGFLPDEVRGSARAPLGGLTEVRARKIRSSKGKWNLAGRCG